VRKGKAASIRRTPKKAKAKTPRSQDEHGAPAKTKDKGTADSSHGWNAAGSE